MIYVYPTLKKEYTTSLKNVERNYRRLYGRDVKVEEIPDKYNVVGKNNCVVNRLCYKIENAFGKIKEQYSNSNFDYSIFKTDDTYSKSELEKIKDIYKEYVFTSENFKQTVRKSGMNKDDANIEKIRFIDTFKQLCFCVISNEYSLCNALIDLCEQKIIEKQFLWNICGDTMLDVLSRSKKSMSYPCVSDDEYDFLYFGEKFVMKDVCLDDE